MADQGRAEPLAFESLGWHEIIGRGWVVTVKNPGGYPDPGVLVGQRVLVDDVTHSVRGVEKYAIALPYPDHLDFALLIEGEPPPVIEHFVSEGDDRLALCTGEPYSPPFEHEVKSRGAVMCPDCLAGEVHLGPKT